MDHRFRGLSSISEYDESMIKWGIALGKCSQGRISVDHE
jgi:hypothetical protein